MSGSISGNGINTFGYTGVSAQASVATTGTYYIVAYGAQGGTGDIGAGGLGAEIGGVFNLTANEALTIAVGGAGGDYVNRAGGGGGGSFVVGPSNTPLVVAGGGGGGILYTVGDPGQTGTSGSTPAGPSSAAGGTNGAGGGAGVDPDDGGGAGGGGFSGSGNSNANAGGGGGYPGLAGGAVGTAGGGGGGGGFGGGGGSGGYGGGGGGGYSGGGGGSLNLANFPGTGGGGGGGSYDAGTSKLLVAGENSGNGSVFIAPVDTPTIAGTVPNQAILDPATVDPFAAIVISDATLGSFAETVKVTPSSALNGTLSDPNASADKSSVSNGVYTVVGTAAQVQADLRDLVFTPAAAQPGSVAVTGFTVGVSNVAGNSATDISTSVIATAMPQPIQLSAVALPAEKVANNYSLTPFSDVLITDPNVGQTETAMITLATPTAGTLALASDYAGGVALSSSAPGTYVLTAASPNAEAAAIGALQFEPGTSGTTTITLSVQDTAGQRASAMTGALTVDPGPMVTDTTTPGGKVAHGTTVSVGIAVPGLPGDTLGLTEVAGPNALTLSNGAVSFTAPPTATGAVSFSYYITDQFGESSPTISDTVEVDPGPMVTDITTPGEKVAHGTTVSVGTAVPGLTGDTLGLTEVTGPNALTLSNGTVSFTAPPTANGPVSFSYYVTDQLGERSTTISDTVAVDPGPIVTDTTTPGEKVAHGTTVSLGTAVQGLPGDTLALTEVTGPTGAVTLSNGKVSFAAPATASGSLSFSYYVTDQLGDRSPTISDTVAVDPGPTLTAATVPAKLGHGQTTTLGSVTPGLAGDTLSLSVTTAPKYGTLALVNGVVTYAAPTTVPSGGETDSFTYAVKDQLGDVSASASPIIALDPGPGAGNATASVNFGVTANVTSAILAAVALGLPGDTETVTAIGSSSPNGSETLSNGQVSFTASGGTLQHIPANGSTSVSFADTITDQLGDSSNGSVAVTVSNPADTIAGSIYGNAIIQGTSGADVITAYGYNNTINDNGGNDLVNAGAGQATVNTSSGDVIVHLSGQNNVVSGGDGYDTVSGSQGNTRITLGNGNDTITLGGSGNTATLGNGTDSVTGSTGNTTITVGNGPDTIQAGGNNNTISIGTGTDTVALNGYGDSVTGGGGADSVSGSTGNATIRLGNGVDTVSAGGSNNSITTGSSGDTITLTGSSNLTDAGGGTNMVFLGGNTQETLVLHLAGDDVIAGFNVNGNDVLRLGSLLSEAHVNLNGSLSQLGTYLHATSSSGNTSLSFDSTGAFAGHQMEVANLAGITTTLANLQSHNVFSLS